MWSLWKKPRIWTSESHANTASTVGLIYIFIRYSIWSIKGNGSSEYIFQFVLREASGQIILFTVIFFQRKRQLCEEMVSLLDILQPGFSCRRGMILYELHTVLLILGLGNVEQDETKSKTYLKRSLKCLKECLKILKFQSRSTFPGKLYVAVSATASDIETCVKNKLSSK